jgi:hypothetical protein
MSSNPNLRHLPEPESDRFDERRFGDELKADMGGAAEVSDGDEDGDGDGEDLGLWRRRGGVSGSKGGRTGKSVSRKVNGRRKDVQLRSTYKPQS